jgi:hypothetical protein
MKDISLFNNSFNVQKSSTYHLSVQLGLDGYAFSVSDAIRKRYNGLKIVRFQEKYNQTSGVFLDFVRQQINGDAFLNKNYKAVSFVYAFPSVIVIPKNSFNRQDIKFAFELHYSLHDEDELQFNHVKGWDLYTVFSVPSDLTNYLVNKFPQVEFYHQTSIWLQSLYNKQKEIASFTAVFFNSVSFYLAVVENGQMMFFNSYRAETDLDAVYYILDVLKNLKKDPLKVEIILAGDVEENSERHKTLLGFFSTFSFLKLDNNTTYVYSFDELPEHLLFPLLALE